MNQTGNTVRPEDTHDMTNSEVFTLLEEGDKILWDGKKAPLTVTAGYDEGDEDVDHVAPVMVEGPRGGQKMLNQNIHNPDRIAADSFSLSSNGEWIKNLRIVEKA